MNIHELIKQLNIIKNKIKNDDIIEDIIININNKNYDLKDIKIEYNYLEDQECFIGNIILNVD